MEDIKDLKKISLKDYDSVRTWSYNLAREWAIKHLVPKQVTSARLFAEYKRKGGYLPKYFPRDTHRYYKTRGTWGGWNDFFGNLSLLEKHHYVDFETAKAITHRAGMKTSRQFLDWKDRPKCIPAQPKFHYDEWAGWEDFLGDNYLQNSAPPNSKLKERDVLIIKHQLSLGVPAAQLAKMFNVSDMQIIRIKRGENWSHVTL